QLDLPVHRPDQRAPTPFQGDPAEVEQQILVEILVEGIVECVVNVSHAPIVPQTSAKVRHDPPGPPRGGCARGRPGAASRRRKATPTAPESTPAHGAPRWVSRLVSSRVGN